MPTDALRSILPHAGLAADRAAEIAVKTVADMLGNAPVVTRVIFCCFSRESSLLHEQALTAFGSPCAD